MKKKMYQSPNIKVVKMKYSDALLQSISIPIGPGPGPGGGGDAKGGFFDDVEDEEIENSRPWGDISY